MHKLSADKQTGFSVSPGREIYLLDCRCLNDDWFINLGKRHPQHFTLDHCHGETKSVTDAGLKQFFQHCSGSLMVTIYV